MAANFNNSAWFYDCLAQFIYGRSIINAQLFLINYIKTGDKVLIVGGGTGWILDKITILHPSGLNITYVEVARNMMMLAKKRNTGKNQVLFLNDTIENVNLNADFDIVITPFLFDNFTEQTLKKVFNHIATMLKDRGLWLNADFQLTGKWWQGFLLKTMFLFFKVLCNIEANKLPVIQPHFNSNGYRLHDEKTFYNDFIIARVYQTGN